MHGILAKIVEQRHGLFSSILLEMSFYQYLDGHHDLHSKFKIKRRAFDFNKYFSDYTGMFFASYFGDCCESDPGFS